MDKPLPPTRNGYILRGRFTNFAARVVDGLLGVVCGPGATQAPGRPGRILVSNIAHLGDVIISTAVIEPLAEAFPDAEIGFLTGSWAAAPVVADSRVKYRHIFDHPLISRAALSRGAKMRLGAETFRRAAKEIRAVGYDAAVDLRPFFPNSLPLLWKAGIPVRIGYTSGALGPLATHRLAFDDRLLPISSRMAALLEPLGVLRDPNSLRARVQVGPSGDLVRDVIGAGAKVAALHTGSGAPNKEWPVERWRRLAAALAADGFTLAFTGVGDRDQERIREIIAGSPQWRNLCNQLPFDQFAALLSKSAVVVCGDTSASHLAAAVGTPCVVIMSGQQPYLFRPMGDASRVLTHPVPCTPCHRNVGCEGMECLRSVSEDQVLRAVRDVTAVAPPIG